MKKVRYLPTGSLDPLGRPLMPGTVWEGALPAGTRSAFEGPTGWGMPFRGEGWDHGLYSVSFFGLLFFYCLGWSSFVRGLRHGIRSHEVVRGFMPRSGGGVVRAS